MAARSDTVLRLVAVLAGPIIWAGYHGTVYFTQTMVCRLVAPPGQQGAIMWLGGGLTAGAAGLLLLLLLRWMRERPGGAAGAELRFERLVSIGLALLALLAVVWVGLPLAMLSPCNPG